MLPRYPVRSGLHPCLSLSPYSRSLVLSACSQRQIQIPRFSQSPSKFPNVPVPLRHLYFRNQATISVSPRLLEEETLPDYDPEDFCPARLGDWIVSRYRGIGKLGYGANSTVWFCRDYHENQSVAVKIYIRTPAGRVNREKALYERLADLTTMHPGSQCIRQALDVFELVRKLGNDHFVLADYEEAEARDLNSRKLVDGDRTIYASRSFQKPREHAYGLPVLCGFGEVRIGTSQAYAEIQPDIYKAPKILMQFVWGHKADI